MTTTLPLFEAQTETNRRLSAQLLHRWLQLHHPRYTATYDGDRTVDTGPIHVSYQPWAVEIRFPDPMTDDDTDVVVYIPGRRTFGAVSTVMEGLLAGWQVTP